MAAGARSLAAVRRRNFNYTTRQQFCQALFHRQFAQRFSQNLYFTNKKDFGIIIIVKRKDDCLVGSDTQVNL